MKPNIHPEYREVVFKDLASDEMFLIRSTIQTKDKITFTDGKEYPLAKIDISAKSHPFYTGQEKMIDTAGRVERFNKKYAKKQ